MPTPQQTAFQRLLTIMDELREQCPWDKKQTFLSLRKLTIEETYELADELLKEDIEGIKRGVLGWVLWEVVENPRGKNIVFYNI